MPPSNNMTVCKNEAMAPHQDNRYAKSARCTVLQSNNNNEENAVV